MGAVCHSLLTDALLSGWTWKEGWGRLLLCAPFHAFQQSPVPSQPSQGNDGSGQADCEYYSVQ